MIEVSAAEFNAAPLVRVVRVSAARVWGMTATERLRRAFARCGLTDIDHAGAPADARPTIVVRGDYVFDEALARGLADRAGVLFVNGEVAVAAHVGADRVARVAAALERGELVHHAAFAGLQKLGVAELAGTANQALRKRQPPLALSLESHASGDVEWRLFGAAYKGITDLVTKWVWPRPAFHVTRWCAKRGITPNQVTAASFVLVVLALGLFHAGWYASGLVAAWAMTFLDTVDGKLARVTLTSSPIGNVFDHGIDLLHPPFWYVAWRQGLGSSTIAPETLGAAVWIVVVGYVVGRLLEGVFLALFKFEAHAWRPVDSLFRQVTARRNPNLLLLTTSVLGGRPDIGLLAIAAWTLASLAFHTTRTVQALAGRVSGRPPASWLESDEPVTGLARYAA